MKPNRNQKKAIETIDENLLVNAGAGTGKTKVLVERYINILEKGKLPKGDEIESIIAITFTKKAAEEMKTRIRYSLEERFYEDNKWRRLHRDVENGNISTIHSFCANILRENPIEAEVDPMFKIIDDNISDELLKSSIKQVLNDVLKKEVEAYKLFYKLDSSTISELVDDFYTIFNQIRNNNESFEELKIRMLEKLKTFQIHEEDLYDIQNSIYDLKNKLASNAKIHRLKDDENWLKFINNQYKDYNELINILNYIEGFLGSSKKQEENINYIKTKINKVLKVKELENRNFYIIAIDILKQIEEVYSKKKKDNSYLDYDDLQLKTYKLLKKNKKVREYYQEKYKYIMIDEFQDTNELQKDIFYILSSKDDILDQNKLFVVGDPKQSIYGFRGADLEVFYDVKSDINQGRGSIVNLEENYRTSEKIMSFLNYSFQGIMGEKYLRLNSNKRSKKNLEVEVIENSSLKIPEGESIVEYSRKYEAQMIARRIKLLVNEGYDYRDIALLFRAGTRNYIYEKALKDYGIPYYNSGGTGYFQRQEVIDVINSFKAIFNPFDFISNIGFLRSPMIGLTDIDIFHIMKKEGDICKKLESVLEENNEDISKNLIKETLKLYKHLISFSKKNPYSLVIEEIIEKTLYRETLLLMDNSRQLIANVDKYVDLINKYEEDNLNDSEDIISYMDRISLRREPEATSESESSNVVKIMTIHKAKGLEFPVVILPELSTRGPNRHFKIKYDKDLGIGLNIENNSGIYDSIGRKEKIKEEEESKRVLYVGMTRAEELLILGNQGYNSGFKKIISDYIREEHCRNIDYIDMEKDRARKDISIIDERNLNYYKDETNLPNNLIEWDDYDKEIKNNNSISQYMTFKSCKREFYYRYKLNLNLDLFKNFEKSRYDESITKKHIPATQKGNIIHDFIERYRIGKDKNTLIKEILEQYDYNYLEYKSEINPYIKNYLDFYKEDLGEIKREEEVSILIGDVKFIGYIDMVIIKENKVDIIDFKTNQIFDKQKLIEYYKPQLQFYAYAYNKLSDYRISSSKVCFLEDGDFIDIDIDKASLKNLENELNLYSKFINKYDEIEDYSKCKICNPYCEYDIVCNKKY